jgi:HK97 family phage portal protein
VNPFGTFVADTAPASVVDAPARERRSDRLESWLAGFPGSFAGVSVTEHSSLKLSSVLAAVNCLSTDVAMIPLRVYRRMADGSREIQDGHPVDDLLHVSPDDETTPLMHRQALMGHALLWGNGYVEIQRRRRGTPYRLYLLDPDLTYAERDSETKRLQYRLDGKTAVDPINVLHLAGLGHDGVNGYCFVRLLNQAIALGIAADMFAGDFFANGSDPGGIIEIPGSLDDDDAVQRLRSTWEGRHAGPGKRKKVAILEGGAKWHETGTDPETSQLLDTRKHQVIDATRPWRVPPHKVGDFSQAHLANIEASNLDYLQTALLPWLMAIEQQVNMKLFSKAERAAGYYAEHNVNVLMRVDIKTRFAAYKDALAAGWMSRDEVRRKENDNPIGKAGGGSKYLVQLNQTTLEKIGDQAVSTTPAALPPADPEDVVDPADPEDTQDPTDAQS